MGSAAPPLLFGRTEEARHRPRQIDPSAKGLGLTHVQEDGRVLAGDLILKPHEAIGIECLGYEVPEEQSAQLFRGDRNMDLRFSVFRKKETAATPLPESRISGTASPAQ